MTKFTFETHFSQNSHNENLIFHKIHIFKYSFSSKFTFLEPLFTKKNHIFQTSYSIEFLDKKVIFAPVCFGAKIMKESSSTNYVNCVSWISQNRKLCTFFSTWPRIALPTCRNRNNKRSDKRMKWTRVLKLFVFVSLHSFQTPENAAELYSKLPQLTSNDLLTYFFTSNVISDP